MRDKIDDPYFGNPDRIIMGKATEIGPFCFMAIKESPRERLTEILDGIKEATSFADDDEPDRHFDNMFEFRIVDTDKDHFLFKISVLHSRIQKPKPTPEK